LGGSNTTSFVDQGTCSSAAYNGDPIRTLWVR